MKSFTNISFQRGSWFCTLCYCSLNISQFAVYQNITFDDKEKRQCSLTSNTKVSVPRAHYEKNWWDKEPAECLQSTMREIVFSYLHHDEKAYGKVVLLSICVITTYSPVWNLVLHEVLSSPFSREMINLEELHYYPKYWSLYQLRFKI